MKIPFRLPSLNEYINVCRNNRYGGAKWKREWEDKIIPFLDGQYYGNVTISFKWYEPNKRRDVDNIASAKKFVLDAMQKKGVVRNDKQVIGFTDSFIYGSGEGVEVEIKGSEMEGE